MFKRKRKFDSATVVGEIARESVGQPKPTAVLVDKRRIKEEKQVRRELRELVK